VTDKSDNHRNIKTTNYSSITKKTIKRVNILVQKDQLSRPLWLWQSNMHSFNSFINFICQNAKM